MYGHPRAGLLWEDTLKSSSFGTGMGRSTELEMLVHREQGLFLSGYVDDMKMAGKKQNFDPI